MRKYGFKLFSTNLQNNPAFIDEAAAGSGSIWKKRRGSFVCSAIRGL